MTLFNTRLFRNEHNAFYSNRDMTILDEYRSVVPIGPQSDINPKGVDIGNPARIADVSNIDYDDLVEIDISKEFGAAFTNNTHIPIFLIFLIYSSRLRINNK